MNLEEKQLSELIDDSRQVTITDPDIWNEYLKQFGYRCSIFWEVPDSKEMHDGHTVFLLHKEGSDLWFKVFLLQSFCAAVATIAYDHGKIREHQKFFETLYPPMSII